MAEFPKRWARISKTDHTQRKLVSWNQFNKTENYGLIEYVILLNWKSNTESHETIATQVLKHETEPNGFPRIYFRWERCHLWPWSWQQNVSPKFWQLPTILHGRQEPEQQHRYFHRRETLTFILLVLISKKLFERTYYLRPVSCNWFPLCLTRLRLLVL
jgi:hypothetical protein